MRLRFSSFAVFILASHFACSATESLKADGGTTSDSLPCEVADVLASRCGSCHQSPPQSGAPMPLVTWSDLHAPARADPKRAVYDLVSSRIHDDVRPMPQPPNARLSDAETRVLDSWIANGAPPGAGARCAGDAGANEDAGGLGCTPDVTLAPASPYAMPSDLDDQYVCFGVDLATSLERHVVGIAPKIDNRTIVHHVLLFQSDTAESPVPAACSPGGSLSWRMVYGWAPGGGELALPPDVGFPYDATTHWVVQLHYNNVNHRSGQTDASGFALCTTDRPLRYDADVIAFGTQSIDVERRSTLDETCSIRVPPALAGARLFSAFPHMHRHGVAISTELVSSDAGSVSLGKSDPFAFDEQVWRPIDATLQAGDIVKTRCAWTNTTDHPVTFGPNTEDEMCYSFTAYYPRVKAPGWSWATPSTGSSCVRTP